MMRAIEELVVLVTGSTDGIGKRTALRLASMGAKVLLHGRDPEKGRSVLNEVEAAAMGQPPEYYNADLSSLSEVRSLAAAVSSDHPDLNVLINNAGIGYGRRGERRREISADGYELRFAVNYLAPFLLTHLLLPTLRRSAPSRIVNVSSLGQRTMDLLDLMLERQYDARRAYGQSKLALAMFTMDLAERLSSEAVTVNAVHPGSLLDTKMVREAFGMAWGSVEEGADAIIHLATSPKVDGVTGKFFDQMTETMINHQAYDRAIRTKLYRISREMVGLEAGDPFTENEK